MTSAVTEYLLQWQDDTGHWKPQSIRPPSEESLFTITYVALRALKVFGSGEQQERINRRVERVREWLLKTPPQSTEDRVFRLWALRQVDAGDDRVREATGDLLGTQRDDGGWAQLPGMGSDAYATGTAMVALHQAGGISADAPPFRRGLSWLLNAQRPDGSWHVRTRSRPIQTYYESGYPHGGDQFISITAAGWATIALVLALPEASR
jgi:squalene cyclase